jgi:hypothetical protein
MKAFLYKCLNKCLHPFIEKEVVSILKEKVETEYQFMFEENHKHLGLKVIAASPECKKYSIAVGVMIGVDTSRIIIRDLLTREDLYLPPQTPYRIWSDNWLEILQTHMSLQDIYYIITGHREVLAGHSKQLKTQVLDTLVGY